MLLSSALVALSGTTASAALPAAGPSPERWSVEAPPSGAASGPSEAPVPDGTQAPAEATASSETVAAGEADGRSETPAPDEAPESTDAPQSVAPESVAPESVVPESAAAASAPETAVEPVVIPLTDAAGERTEVATSGLEVSVPAGEFSTSSEKAVVGTDAVLTQPIPTEEFLVAGLTWEAGQQLAADAQVFVRVEEDGVWSEWEETSHEEGMTGGSETAAGTDPFVTGGAETIQIRVTGSAAELPDNLAITVLATEALETPAVAAEAPESTPVPVPTVTPAAPGSNAVVPAGMVGASVAASPVATTVVPPRPSMISRAGWGANETQMNWQPTYRALKAAVVHHTAGTNTYSQSEAASVVRGIYYYHAVTRGWGDIGYNFLVDKWGRVYEGRTGSLASPAGMMPQGAHAAPVNNGTVGISAMGDYTKVAVPTAVIDSMTNVLAWQFGRAGLNATTTSGIYSPGTPALVKGVNLPRIFGHMDVSATACPGKDIYGRLATMRTAVAAKTHPPFSLERVDGADRFAVSAATSRANFAPGVAVAYVANGLTSADALTSAPVAAMKDAPVLLTQTGALPASIAGELARLQPRKIVVLGGTGAVSTNVEQQLARYAPTVTRVTGADRYAVSAAVSRENFGAGVAVAYIANGQTSADALSAAPVAGASSAPVLLTQAGGLPAAIRTELARLKPRKIVVLGGTGAVSSTVQEDLARYAPAVERWSGQDRYAVSAAVSASSFAAGAPVVYVANGLTSVDALSGAPVAGMKGAPVLLTQPGALPASVLAELRRLDPRKVVILGGTGAVSSDVEKQLGRL
ncbi:putative cell wall-binding protein [Georgenia soli]|uniref:Putative cell wall-binding protein n=2 Tax=Georgenia soli TaxID=638953 RepID=A0A2A9ESC4_9MICO|nr:putative cell wall-binding protein [Georgenia soli]